MCFSRRLILALEYYCKRSIFFEDFFWGGFVCFRKENSFCELWRNSRRVKRGWQKSKRGPRMGRGPSKEGSKRERSYRLKPRRIGQPRLLRNIRWSMRGRFGLITLMASRSRWRGEAPSALSILSPLLKTSGGMFFPFLLLISCSYLDFCLPVVVAIFLVLSLHCGHRKRLLLSFFPSCSLRTRRQLFLFPFAPHACKDMWYKMLRH